MGLTVGLALTGAACSSTPGTSPPTTTTRGIVNLTPHGPAPTGQPVVSESTPNLACTLISSSNVSALLGEAFSPGQSRSDGGCWFTRVSSGPGGLPGKVILTVEPVNQFPALDQIFQRIRKAPGAKRVVVDSSTSYWISLPLPLPRADNVASGSLTTEVHGDVISADAEFLQHAESASERIMAFALTRLGSE
jgi:hypothetical protein